MTRAEQASVASPAPIGLGASLLYFAIPATVTAGLYFGVLWVLRYGGVLPYYAHLIAITVGIAPLFVASSEPGRALRLVPHPLDRS